MILDRSKTIDALINAVLDKREEYSIEGDNLDELQLIIDEDEDGWDCVIAETDRGVRLSLDDLSTEELEVFCYEYEVKPVYDINKSANEFKDYLVSQIKSEEYGDGLKLVPFVHDPYNVEDYVAVNYIDGNGYVCLYNPYNSDERAIYKLSELYIDDLLKIINVQSSAVI